MKGLITEIHRTSIVDGPGIRTTVFTKGCALRCIWCHNPETQGGGLENGYGRRVSVEEVVAVCLKDKHFYDESGGGVTVSGGEPVMQHAFSFSILHSLKELGIHTALDTAGDAPPAVFEESLDCTDLYLFDYKASEPTRHEELTGKPLAPILQILDFLVLSGAGIILRCPLIPGVNDDESHLSAISEMENKYPGLQGIHILPWHTMGRGKYAKLGRTADPRLPTQSSSVETLDTYRRFFRKRGNQKVSVIA